MKGIIMAGGAGSRLRPLTCDLPKPMVPVMNRPVMQYSIELFRKYGINDIGVTLQYLPEAIQDYFGDGGRDPINLHYFIEEKPLGTAGSVKNAQEILDDTFIVLSGDALTNIDLEKAADFHRQNQSMATLVLKKVEIPLEYGVVMTHGDGRIARFLEKPGWGEVFSDTVNTGIYILEPQVLEYFETGVKFDFSKDLFPRLLEDRKPMFGYITEEYWCDVGDTNSYLQSHFDIMNGDAGIKPDAKELEDGVWVEEGVYIHPGASIAAPCYIGRNTTIGEGVSLHPFTVIGENNHIGEHSSIKRSVLWNHNSLGRNVEARGAIVCDNTRVGNNCSIFEGSVVGKNTHLHERVVLKPDAKIWPCKTIEQGMTIDENIIWGTRLKRTLFGKDGIRGCFNIEIDAGFVNRLGTAYGTELKEDSRICISSNGHEAAIMLKHSLMAGVLTSGLSIFDIGSTITPVTRYAVRHLGLDGGIHIRCEDDDPNRVHIGLIDNNGANLPDSMERKIENIFISGDFSVKSPNNIKKVSIINDIEMFYIRHLINSIDAEAIKQRKYRILLSAKSKSLASLFMAMTRDLGCRVEVLKGQIMDAESIKGYDLAIGFDDDGERLEILDEGGEAIKEGTMVALISLVCFKQDKDVGVVIPNTAPSAIEKMAKNYNGSVIRSKTKRRAMMEEVIKAGDSEKRKVMERFILYFDGLATVMGIMDLMAREDKKLSDLVEDLPGIYMAIRDIECPWTAKGKVMRSLIDEANRGDSDVELYEGVKITEDKGWTLILPDSDEPLVKIYSEGFSEEYAEELSDFYEKRINGIKEQ
ncbi:MAG TPA: sugar phosphate nucleotidyltransferase [Clostridia bacterium]|nr:sugar phosphate nucleotidyltransferase [Clostridia bacterium]